MDRNRDRDSLTAAARTSVAQLALDALALQAYELLASHGIRVYLLKGPVTADWLYDRPSDRPYTDVDLLVANKDLEAAQRIFEQQGFVDWHARVLGIYRPAMERAWSTSRGIIDLHSGIEGIPRELTSADLELIGETQSSFVLHGRRLLILTEPARALHLALHAAQAEPSGKALLDLDRGLGRVSEDVWSRAAVLARQLDALPAFASGLARHSRGIGLLEKLGVTPASTVVTALLSRRAMSEAVAVERLVSMKSGARRRDVRGWLSVEETHEQERLWTRRLKVSARLVPALGQWFRARRAVRRGVVVTDAG